MYITSLDVKMVFLYGKLKEVYMKQPEGFVRGQPLEDSRISTG